MIHGNPYSICDELAETNVAKINDPIPLATHPPRPKLLDRVREVIRSKHDSYRTEQAYLFWIKRFILFHHKCHPQEMGAGEVQQFLTHLAVSEHVAAATQNQALCAIVFLYINLLIQNRVYNDVIILKPPAGDGIERRRYGRSPIGRYWRWD